MARKTNSERRDSIGPIFLLGPALILLAAAISPICAGAQSITKSPLLAPEVPDSSETLFQELTAKETGVHFINRWLAPLEYEFALSLSFASGGVAIGDIDSDGLPDLYLTRPFGGGKLYRNLGGMRFEDVTGKRGLADENFWQGSPSFADIDNDGDLDLFVCAVGSANRLYLNRGEKFEEVAQEAGLNFSGFSINMAFADYDLDGDLDGYLVTNRPFSATQNFDVNDRAVAQALFPKLEKLPNGRFKMPENLRQVFDVRWNPEGKMDMLIQSGQVDRLYRNDGPSEPGGIPKFTDVTKEAGLLDNGMGLSATWFDFDSDRDPDLYVANDYYGSDRLFQNNGDGTFTEITGKALPHIPWYSMGSNFADINNDGLLDFMGSDMMGTNHFRQKIGMGDMNRNAWFLDHAKPRQYMRNALYLNTGTGRFLEGAFLAGVAKSDWTWALKFGDLDNDGRVDLFIANGMTGDFFNSDTTAARRKGIGLRPDENEPRPEPKRDVNLAFKNLGDLEFKNVSQEWGLDKAAASFGAALGDLDNDGDLDLVVSNFDEPASIYRNQKNGSSNRIKIQLQGKESNHFGIGATIRLWKNDGQILTRYLSLSRGYYASDDPVIHFGLGREKTAKRLVIDWPSGSRQSFTDLEANHLYQITEQDDQSSLDHQSSAPIYRQVDLSVGEHQEQVYDDYNRQPLLPQKHSQLGPGVAWGDLDGDGDEDFFLGQGKGRAGEIHLNQNGQFSVLKTKIFEADRESEDMASLIFDADGDGDNDLYVVSGGVECEPGSPELRDRLYLNDGEGNFTKGSLPDLLDSGSVICAADFDRDDDLDLFVGSRIVPGRYPETPKSRLLVNEGKGQFIEATPDDLRDTGLVTSALWSDVNGDGWIDLLVTHDWGPVKIYLNQDGKLGDQTQESGLAELTGWWNSIAAADIDADGDMDYAVGNLGLNTKYHASPDHPVMIYYGDLDGQGRPKIVEAEFEGSTLYPVRGRSCSSNAMPNLRDKFPTFKSFALAPLDEIYEQDRLKSAKRVTARTLKSGILINKGANNGVPKFEFRPLPRVVQIAPVFGLQFTDFNNDHYPDLLLAQNSHSPQRETGIMAGGLGLLLENEAGHFRALRADKSGIVIPGDASSLTSSDWNQDGSLEFHVTINNGKALAFERNRLDPYQPGAIALRLVGKAGNPTAIGARVKVPGAKKEQGIFEIQAGGGYLSQSSPVLYLPAPAETPKNLTVEVSWPNGRQSEHVIEVPDGRTVPVLVRYK